MKTCLVTGGCGFIGRNLTRHLIKEGWRVDIVDDLSNSIVGDLSNIDVNVVIDDFSSNKVKNLIKDKKYNTIFHLAATSSVKLSVEKPASTTENNILSSVKLFEYAIGNVKRIVFSSSAAVYGNKYEYGTNSMCGKHPETPYAWQKSSIEDISKIFCNLYNIDIVSLRYFNVYGPGQIGDTQYSSVISSWIHCIENNKPLILEGDGNQSRDFVYIDDIIRANIIVANHNKQFNGIAYNVSTGISTTNNMILKCFEEYFGELDIVKVPPRKGDIDFSLGNSSRIKSHLNFSTKVPFSEGIIKTFNYHSNLKETK